MQYSLVGIPQEQDLKLLNSLRNYIYQNDFRFKNKSLDSDTHITLTNVILNSEEEIEQLKEALLNEISSLKKFSVSKSEWILTKEEKGPNDKIDSPYTWIALKFPQRKEIYEALDRLTKKMVINNNAEYIGEIKKIEGDISDDECIANHINLSNYTKKGMAEKCWKYFDFHLPDTITFKKLGLRDEKGALVFNMFLSDEDISIITPANHLRAAEAWLSTYYLITTQDIHQIDSDIVAYYCLFQAFELYMKAYIAFKDPLYLYSSNIKKYNHSLRKLINKVSLYCSKEMKKKLEEIYKKEVLKDNDGDEIDFTQELRYGCVNSLLILSREITHGDAHRFTYVINYIKRNIRKSA